MTFGAIGGLEDREPLKAGENGHWLNGAIRWAVPGPGARSSGAKIMRRLPFHGPGGQTVRSADEGVLSQ
jgi:hypothetical protein